MTHAVTVSWHVARSVDALLICGGKQVTTTGPKTVAELGGVRIRHTDLRESSTILLLTLAFKKRETTRPNGSHKNEPPMQKTTSRRQLQ